MITIKSAVEIDAMARAGRLLAEVTSKLMGAVSEGQRTVELDRLAGQLIVAAGAIPGFKGYQGFPRNICISVNEEVVHGIPGRRRLRQGDLVSLDLGLIKDQYWADCGVTVAVGEASPAAQHLMVVTQQALEIGIAQAVVGNHLGDVSGSIQQHVEAAGYSVVRELVGHGIGRQMHEDPAVPNYGSLGTGPLLREGMTLAIEPMVVMGTPGILVKPDGWTVVSRDGSLSAYFEHTVAITAAGPRVLTRREDEQP